MKTGFMKLSRPMSTNIAEKYNLLDLKIHFHTQNLKRIHSGEKPYLVKGFSEISDEFL